MLWGHDLGWWAFILTLVGLALMFPVAILANLCTPALKNWWSERSAATTKTRIEKLKQQLADYEQNYGLMSDVEEQLFRGIEGLAGIGTMSLQFLVICFLLAFAQVSTVPVKMQTGGLPLGLAAFISGSSYGLAFGVFGKISAFQKKTVSVSAEYFEKVHWRSRNAIGAENETILEFRVYGNPSQNFFSSPPDKRFKNHF